MTARVANIFSQVMSILKELPGDFDAGSLKTLI